MQVFIFVILEINIHRKFFFNYCFQKNECTCLMLFLFYLTAILKWESEDIYGCLLIPKLFSPPHSLLIYVKYILVIVHSSFSLGWHNLVSLITQT